MPIAVSQPAPIAELQAERFFLLNNAQCDLQFADTPSGCNAQVSQGRSAATRRCRKWSHSYCRTHCGASQETVQRAKQIAEVGVARELMR